MSTHRACLRMLHRSVVAAMLLTGGGASSASADVVLLLGESYGRFGTFSPTGHTAVYLTRVCAESPIVLRRCRPGELGAVISRYHRIGGLDWAAIPLMPYLYAVERAADVPVSAGPEDVMTLRDRYRRTRLGEVAPNLPSGATPSGDWVQLVGGAYDRRFIAFSLTTTPDQDDRLVDTLNGSDNRRRFNLLTRNCADFARDIVNFYYPGSVRGSVVADLGFTTPKQVTKAVARFATRHPTLRFQAFAVSQIPGSRRSRDARGVLESLVKTKKYVVPLALAQPLVPVVLAAGYVLGGRFRPLRHAGSILNAEALEQRALSLDEGVRGDVGKAGQMGTHAGMALGGTTPPLGRRAGPAPTPAACAPTRPGVGRNEAERITSPASGLSVSACFSAVSLGKTGSG